MKYVFLNGRLIAEAKAKISVTDRGFVYGDGFFETILCVKGRPQLFPEHEVRLRNSCREFHIPLPDDIHFESIVKKVIIANKLSEGFARVKIIVTRGMAEPGLSFKSTAEPTVLITALPYSLPEQPKYTGGIDVAVFPQPHVSPLARHKSLNYLYYIMARNYAIKRKTEEAILCDHQGRVLECSAANIFVRKGRLINIPPADAPYLHGIMEKHILSIMTDAGYEVKEEYFHIDRLLDADEVFISNSLIGALPVVRIDGEKCNPDFEASIRIKQKLEKVYHEYF
ncbi:MAG: aminotransferase class IV [Spirochaetota bacterium]